MQRYTLLQNCQLIDGVSPEPRAAASVLIEGERITQVGGVDEIKPPPQGEGEVVDASGRTVMPGMVDCHFHGAYHDVSCFEDYDLRRPIEHTTILAARNAQTLLEVGFTSARDVGTRGLVAVALRDMIDQGVIKGPRMKPGARILTTTGGLADFYGNWADNQAALGHTVDGPAEILKATRLQIKYGVTNIKVEASGTGISPFASSTKQTMTEEEIATVVNESKRNGVRVACHAQATEGIKNGVRAGVTTIEHGSFLDEEGADLMIERGTVLVPTIAVLYLYVHKGPEVGVPDWVVQKFKGDLDLHYASVKMAREKGIPMVVGSDSGHAFNPQNVIAIELELMVRLTDFTPMEAIQSATSIGAKTIGLGDVTGQITPGYCGDVLVVDGDPLADVGILQQHHRLERVYKGGVLEAGTVARRAPQLELASVLEKEPPIAGGALDPVPSRPREEEPHAHRPSCLQHSEELENS